MMDRSATQWTLRTQIKSKERYIEIERYIVLEREGTDFEREKKK